MYICVVYSNGRREMFFQVLHSVYRGDDLVVYYVNERGKKALFTYKLKNLMGVYTYNEINKKQRD